MTRFFAGVLLFLCSSLALAEGGTTPPTTPNQTPSAESASPSPERIRLISRFTVLGSAALLVSGNLLAFCDSCSEREQAVGAVFFWTGTAGAIIAPTASSFRARKYVVGLSATSTRALMFMGTVLAITPFALAEFITPEERAQNLKIARLIIFSAEAAVLGMGLAEGALSSRLLAREPKERALSLSPVFSPGPTATTVGLSARLRW